MGLFRKLSPQKPGEGGPSPSTPAAPGAPPSSAGSNGGSGPAVSVVVPAAPSGPAAAKAPVATVAGGPASPGPSPSPSSAPAKPAAPAAAAGPAPAAVPDGLIKNLADKIATLAKNLDAERASMKDFNEKVHTMEDRMKSLHNLSELLSMKYNPFLGDAETDSFEGGPARQEELPKREPAAAPAPPAPPAAKIERPTGGDAASAASLPGTSSEVKGDKPRAAPAPTPPPPPFHAGNGWNTAATAITQFAPSPAAPSAKTEGAPTPGLGYRESYVALAWMNYLLEEGGPRGVFTLIDYYHEVGWIPHALHGWFHRLAEGLVQQPFAEPGRRWLSNDPKKVLKVHKTSLRFLDAMFRADLYQQNMAQMDRLVASLTPGTR